MFQKLAHRYAACARVPGFFTEVAFGTVLLVISLIFNQYAIDFATEHASNSVTDLILSNIPIFDVDAIFVYGTAVAVVYGIALCLLDPKGVPFMLKTGALFFVIRSAFLSLTHLAPFVPHITTSFGTAINHAFFGDDLFFSGHTGLPFLAALAFWDWPLQRYIFLGMSIFFAVIVLLGHYHYSIDVASAFFITYGIYDIAKWAFPRDYKLSKAK